MNGDMVTFPGLGLEFEFSRVAFTVFGRNIYWYGIIIACGFLLAVIYAYARCKQFGITGDDIITMLIFAVPISIICARAYYVIFYYSLYNGDFLKMIRISDGGLAIYGGIIGAVATVVVFCRVRKIRTGAFLDLGSLGLLIGQGIGRWGNFANKEAHGGVTDSFLRMGIYENGKLIKTVSDLSPHKEYSFEIKTENGTNTITVGEGSIWVSSADCSNQTCVHAGKISHAGQTVICAPHKLVIKIVGETSADAVI